MSNTSTQFKPGMVPWNKGMKGLQIGGAKTQFVAGRPASTAHNYLPIGSHRINADGHLERKTTDNPALVPARRWTPVYRLVWEAEFGPIPKGHSVVFRQGMRTAKLEEIQTSKLELVTRAELMKRNTVHRYGEEIAKLVQLRGALNRQINKRAKEQS